MIAVLHFAGGGAAAAVLLEALLAVALMLWAFRFRLAIVYYRAQTRLYHARRRWGMRKLSAAQKRAAELDDELRELERLEKLLRH